MKTAFILFCVLFIGGCQAKIILNPPEDHLYFVQQGSQVYTTKGLITIDKSYLLISEQYLKELVEAIKETKE